MNINKEYIKQAINEFEQIKKALDECNGLSFDAVYDAMSRKFYNNVYNYGYDLFDVELSRVLCTITNDENTIRLDSGCMFDISDDLSGEWVDTNIDELKQAVGL